MSTKEWFRHTAWSLADREDFFAHLKRSRTRYHKAQYLRIQASHLAEVGLEPLIRAALELLDQLLTQYPEETSQLASAYYQRGDCFANLGEHDAAIEAYQKALETQRAHPHSLTPVHSAFAELVVTLNRRELFPEVLKALDEFGHVDAFPIDIYRSEAARALIAADARDLTAARAHAARALAAAAATESGFRFHKKLGLVGFVDPKIGDRLRALSAA